MTTEVTMIKVTEYGHTSEEFPGAPQRVAGVAITSPRLRAHLITLGAAIASVESLDARGEFGPIHLSLETLAEYEDVRRNPHLGGSIGRYANRIAGAQFPLGDQIVHVEPNRGAHHLHGGTDGFDRRVWTLGDTGSTPSGGFAEFTLVSPDGDQGYPGAVTVVARYEIDDDVLRITYRAHCDQPTLVNMTNHGYWHLGGGVTVDGHYLAVAADLLVPLDREGIPEGPARSVAGTPFDLRARRLLGPIIEAVPPGLDHCYLIRGESGLLRPAAVLDCPASGRWMAVHTDQTALQVYTGNGLRPPFARHGSVSLEAQLPPDTPNRPEWGTAELRPGQAYLNVTDLRFGQGPPPVLPHGPEGRSRVSHGGQN